MKGDEHNYKNINLNKSKFWSGKLTFKKKNSGIQSYDGGDLKEIIDINKMSMIWHKISYLIIKICLGGIVNKKSFTMGIWRKADYIKVQGNEKIKIGSRYQY